MASGGAGMTRSTVTTSSTRSRGYSHSMVPGGFEVTS